QNECAQWRRRTPHAAWPQPAPPGRQMLDHHTLLCPPSHKNRGRANFKSVLTVSALAGGNWSSFAVKSDGTVWAWGANDQGQLGDGTTTNRTTPVQVTGLTGVTAIAAGGWHTLALKSDGTIWGWGGNWAGQLGDGTTINRASPVQVGT